jgi:hypothetical protein
MSFYPSKLLRSAAAALLVFVLAALVLALPRTADAATKCKAPAKIWIVNGRKACLKTARMKPGHAGAETSHRLARWFAEVTQPEKGSKLKVPKKLRAAAPKAAAAAAKLVARGARLGKKARVAPKKKFALAASASAGGVVIERMSEDGPTITLPNGVKLSSHVDGRAYEDGTKQFDVNVDISLDGYTVRYKPSIEENPSTIPEVECPTAAGLLTIDYTSSYGGTLMVLKGNNVLGSVTEKFTDTLHAKGHVGRDAKLHDVDVHVISKVEHYERGLQVVSQTSGDFDVAREGEPASTGPISANIKIRAAGATAAQERAAAAELAANVAKSSSAVNGLGSHAEIARWRMMMDEPKWYSLPGRCADIHYSPDSIANLAAGKSADVTARVTARASGGEASGDVAVVGVSRGSFTATKAQVDPGSPARFRAKAATPDAGKLTVGSDVIATSTAGRAQWGWYAKDDLNLPQKISGTISSSSSTPGTKDYFHAWAVYTLDQVYVDDSGYISVWYKLTTADMDEAQSEIGAGCRWVGKGSGGNIADGDIELRKAPGGNWQHAVMYDVEIPNTTYTPTDCGTPAPAPLTMDLVAFVNMAMLGGGFEDVGENFHMEAIRVYEDAASQRKTVASWSFDPGDPQ